MYIWYNLCTFGIIYVHLVYFVVIWYIFPVLVSCTKKNLANLEWSKRRIKMFWKCFSRSHATGPRGESLVHFARRPNFFLHRLDTLSCYLFFIERSSIYESLCQSPPPQKNPKSWMWLTLSPFYIKERYWPDRCGPLVYSFYSVAARPRMLLHCSCLL
jgi:hypothetical protein